MISIGTVAVLGDELHETASASLSLARNVISSQLHYRIALIILLRVDAVRDGPIRHHRLVFVFPKMKGPFGFVVMYALDDLGPDQGTFGHDTLEGHHMVEM